MLVAPNIEEGTVDDGFANILDGDISAVGELVASNVTGLQTFKFEKSVSVESVAEFTNPNL